MIETTRFDAQEHLKTPEDQAAYIEAALETGDPSFIALVLGDVIRARGVTAFARETGFSREAIHKAFRDGGNPTLDTLIRVTKAFGLLITVTTGSSLHELPQTGRDV